ncbi:unnamed protein product, partial [Prorocentrum cordatum]
ILIGVFLRYFFKPCDHAWEHVLRRPTWLLSQNALAAACRPSDVAGGGAVRMRRGLSLLACSPGLCRGGGGAAAGVRSLPARQEDFFDLLPQEYPWPLPGGAALDAIGGRLPQA